VLKTILPRMLPDSVEEPENVRAEAFVWRRGADCRSGKDTGKLSWIRTEFSVAVSKSEGVESATDGRDAHYNHGRRSVGYTGGLVK